MISVTNRIDVQELAPAWQTLQKGARLAEIRDEQHHAEMVGLLNGLIDVIGGDEDHPLADLLELVGVLVDRYESVHHAMPDSAPGRDVLRFLMEEHRLAQTDLPEVGSQGVVSEILSGKRTINVRQARALAKRFGISAGAFI